jgi:ectoine hydroxylase-related dioxygenase (phytanoyl-CoA dioxygenase family)
VAAQLAGAARVFPAPQTTYTICVHPENCSWQWPDPHIDHALEKDAHRTFPPPFQIACLIYLNDVETHSGATIVWPGSHRQLENLARSRPSEYALLWSLNRDIPKLILAEPLEILARAGDVLFYHCLCAHAGSTNAGTQTRLALNHKW